VLLVFVFRRTGLVFLVFLRVDDGGHEAGIYQDGIFCLESVYGWFGRVGYSLPVFGEIVVFVHDTTKKTLHHYLHLLLFLNAV
jgi:hypothetical protein